MTSEQREAYRAAARAGGMTVPDHANVSPLADGGAIVECEVFVSEAAMQTQIQEPVVSVLDEVLAVLTETVVPPIPDHMNVSPGQLVAILHKNNEVFPLVRSTDQVSMRGIECQVPKK